ncbi:glutamate cyclase domain-containing protein [Pseudoalteromonas ostreae]|uniref:glutamate cyclase domain-containing protein n=1 Tax=Pseudoalteromonas ostreae TaxID=2774154 RepID=UPI001B35DC08|nr:glutamate cyclase domain-containing protein [Pseudoalteromonas ostreae]
MPHSLSDEQLSQAIETMMVEQNLRGMQNLYAYQQTGTYLRAAKSLFYAKSTVLIGTGFAVKQTFETDGPVGAIALYNALIVLGKNPILVCGNPLYSALKNEFNCFELPLNNFTDAMAFSKAALAELKPDCVLSIERPGLCHGNKYYNMRGIDISADCGCFDFFVSQAPCPTVAIGDGGNEIGMGNLSQYMTELSIMPCLTCCDELLLADVSNWAAYGIIAFLSRWQSQDLLADVDTLAILQYLSERGSVDGVTHKNELTEDGLHAMHGQQLIARLRQLSGVANQNEDL